MWSLIIDMKNKFIGRFRFHQLGHHIVHRSAELARDFDGLCRTIIKTTLFDRRWIAYFARAVILSSLATYGLNRLRILGKGSSRSRNRRDLVCIGRSINELTSCERNGNFGKANLLQL